MLRQITKTLAVLASAALLAACFPSGPLWWLAWLTLIPFILAVENDPLWCAFVRGACGGFVFFLAAIFWIHHVTAVGLVFLCAYLALYWGLFALAVARSVAWGPWARVFFLAAVWTALEYVRGHALTGFNWASLAHTQSANLAMIQVADVTGTAGVSFLMAAFGVAGALWVRLFLSREDRPAGLRSVTVAVVVLLALCLGYGLWRLTPVVTEGRVRVALIQANVSLADYGDPLLKEYVVDMHLSLSRAVMARRPELLIWPETSFPQFMGDQPALFRKVRDFARAERIPILLGAVTVADGEYFNSAVLIDSDGELAGEYRKQHLVIFGEYIPFRRQFPWLSSLAPIDDFTPGQGNVFFDLGQGRVFSALVCFEDTVPELARRAVLGGAVFLVNITNDAWFEASRQPRMHLDNAVFRAVETRTGLARATNTGMSCGIGPTGDIETCARDAAGREVMVRGVAVVELPLRQGPQTFYTKYGDLFAKLCFAVIMMILALKAGRKGVQDGRTGTHVQDPDH